MLKAHWARFRVFHCGTMYYPSDDEYDRQQRIFGESRSMPCLTMDGEARLCYVNPGYEYNRNDWHELEDTEFMLCTGIKSSLQELTYENDIVEVHLYGIEPRQLPFLAREILYEVVWDLQTAGFTLYNGDENMRLPLWEKSYRAQAGITVTIIPHTTSIKGNRFENPELLDKVYSYDKEVNNGRP